MNTSTNIERAKLINKNVIELIFYSDSECQFRIYNPTSDDRDYIIHCDRGLWRCNCEDYTYAKDKDLGSYCCKHILACIDYIMNNTPESDVIVPDFTTADNILEGSL